MNVQINICVLSMLIRWMRKLLQEMKWLLLVIWRGTSWLYWEVSFNWLRLQLAKVAWNWRMSHTTCVLPANVFHGSGHLQRFSIEFIFLICERSPRGQRHISFSNSCFHHKPYALRLDLNVANIQYWCTRKFAADEHSQTVYLHIIICCIAMNKQMEIGGNVETCSEV